MSTFLQLCADLARESGAIGAAPSAVTAQTGRQDKCVQWVKTAWTLIQNENPELEFLRKDFSGALSINVMQYTGASFALTDHGEWLTGTPVSIYPAGDQAQESDLTWITYDRWRRSFNFGSHSATKPTYYSVAPNGTLCIGAKPDAAYTIRGEYIRTPQELAVNADEPIAPARHHPIIWQRAEMLLLSHDEAWNKLPDSTRRYEQSLRALLRDCTPEFTTNNNALG